MAGGLAAAVCSDQDLLGSEKDNNKQERKKLEKNNKKNPTNLFMLIFLSSKNFMDLELNVFFFSVPLDAPLLSSPSASF